MTKTGRTHAIIVPQSTALTLSVRSNRYTLTIIVGAVNSGGARLWSGFAATRGTLNDGAVWSLNVTDPVNMPNSASAGAFVPNSALPTWVAAAASPIHGCSLP